MYTTHKLQGHHMKLFVTYAVQHTLGSQVTPTIVVAFSL